MKPTLIAAAALSLLAAPASALAQPVVAGTAPVAQSALAPSASAPAASAAAPPATAGAPGAAPAPGAAQTPPVVVVPPSSSPVVVKRSESPTIVLGTPTGKPQIGVVALPPPQEERALFAADPVADGAVLGISAGIAVLSSLLVGTGELRPQKIAADFQTSSLLSIDRGAVTQHPDPNAATYSNIGLYAVVGYAALDPILSGLREKNTRTFLVDFMIYGESLAITESLTNVAKFAVRRPRPYAYIQHFANPKADNNSTDSNLSFFSGHASAAGAVTATATYLAFERSRHSWRPWATLLVGTGITTFIDIERVRAADHFPTDVITGTLVGAGVGVLTVRLHRTDEQRPRPMWIGWQPARVGDGGALTLSGLL
jgi:membrane-associated phospholipid phosphatase